MRIVKLMPKMLFLALLGQCWLTPLGYAFETGQRVWIDMPALNINDDSYGEGEVTADPHTGQVSVYVRSLTTSKAFSSGVFCASPSQSAEGWQTPAVYNLVTNQTRDFPSQQLFPWTEGYNRFYERQNWLHTFLKWVDHHPVIERSQLIEHRDTALQRQQKDLALVSELMLQEFDAYQNQHFQPYPIAERITRLVPVLSWIQTQLTQHPDLEKAWRPLHRDPLVLNSSSLTLFMTEAIDKVLQDAQKTRRLLLDKDQNEKSKAFDQYLQQLQRK